MSGIRILGLCIGIIGLIFTFLYFRGIKWKRSTFILLFFFNTVLIIITISPASLNMLRDMLALETSERGRILTLLIFSVIFLVFAVFYLKSKLDFHLYQFDKLIRALGKRVIYHGEAKQRIKPAMILIPAYNEAENLQELIPRLPTKIDHTEIGVLIVDDGSMDGTADVGEGLGCLVARNVINRGGGAALRLGYDILLNHSVDICVTLDADNQHNPEDLPQLLEPLLNDEADVVVGSRVLGKTLCNNKLRNSGVTLFNFIISRLLKQKITDCSSGFRAFKTGVIKGIKLRQDQYHTSELIIEAVKKGYRIKEVPITIWERKFGHTKKGTNFKYAFNFTKVILKTWWR